VQWVKEEGKQIKIKIQKMDEMSSQRLLQEGAATPSPRWKMLTAFYRTYPINNK